jgi:hypothetical protein
MYVLLSVALEVLDCRRRAPRILSTRFALYTKLALIIISIVLPLITSLTVSLLYTASIMILLLALGLKLTVLYIVLSLSTLYIVLLASAIAFGGSVESVTRFTIIAASTLPTFILVFATTRPSALRRIPALYLLLVIFSSVLREVVDVATVYRAKGSSGMRYWLQVVVALIAVALIRTQNLADSLRARGVEVTE